MPSNSKRLILLLILTLNLAFAFGQKRNLIAFEFSPRLLAAHQNPVSSRPIAERQHLLGTRYGRAGRVGLTATRIKRNNTAWEVAAYGSFNIVKAKMDKSRILGGFGNARLGILLFEAPLRFKFPIYVNMKALERDAEKEPRFLTASIGVQFSKALWSKGREKLINQKDTNGDKQFVRYEFYQNRQTDFGCYSVEFGLGKDYSINKKWMLRASARATIGVIPLAAYELSFSGKVSGTSNVLVKNDAFGLCFTFIKKR